MKKQISIKVIGRVQGIGYRYWAKKTANTIGGISGWVRNVEDGSVEMLISGEEENIDRMIASCYKGPIVARVDEVKIQVPRTYCFLPEIDEGKFEII